MVYSTLRGQERVVEQFRQVLVEYAKVEDSKNWMNHLLVEVSLAMGVPLVIIHFRFGWFMIKQASSYWGDPPWKLP